MPQRKRVPLHQSEFTAENLRGLAADMQKHTWPLIKDRMTVSDDVVTGLRAIVTKDGNITFHSSYHLPNKRGSLLLGELTDDETNPDRMTVSEARHLMRTIQTLAEGIGIDPQEGLHRRLIRELKREGTKWRP